MSATDLDDVVARASGLEVAGWPLTLVRREAPGAGYERVADLYAPGDRLRASVQASAALGGTSLEQVGAQWWFERCAFLVAGAALACGLRARRIPDLGPARTFVLDQAGIPAALGLASAPLAWTGPAGDDDALAAAARAQVEGHLAPLAASLSGLRLRGASALWRAAGDRVVQAALWVGTATGRRTDALALAERMVAGRTRLAVPVRLSGPAEDPASEQQRRSCCLSYRVEGLPLCSGCPRVHGLDRRRRVAAG